MTTALVGGQSYPRGTVSQQQPHCSADGPEQHATSCTIESTDDPSQINRKFFRVIQTQWMYRVYMNRTRHASAAVRNSVLRSPLVGTQMNACNKFMMFCESLN